MYGNLNHTKIRKSTRKFLFGHLQFRISCNSGDYHRYATYFDYILAEVE